MSNKLFTTIPAPKLKRNTFNLSNQVSLTLSFNKLYPARLMEVIPGDVFSVNAEMFSRLQPMIAPVLNSMKLQAHAFYVPLRTIHKHFAEFMFNNKAGNYSDVLPYCSLETMVTDFLDPIVDSETAAAAQSAAGCSTMKQLWDLVYGYLAFLRYMGIPLDYSKLFPAWPESADTDAKRFTALKSMIIQSESHISTVRVNISPFLAYQKVWNEYYRDENLVEDIFDTFNVALDDASSDSPELDRISSWMGDISAAVFQNPDLLPAVLRFFQLRPKAWGKDRFTTALPFAQRGPDVSIPIEVSNSDVKMKTDSAGIKLAVGEATRYSTNAVYSDLSPLVVGAPGLSAEEYDGERVVIDPNGSLYADNSNAAISSTIRDFRRALRLQQWYENSARGGYRPNEATLAHFGVSVPDASLDRAEFLGGTSNVIAVSEVPQTSESANTPQGTLAGKGTAYSSNHLFKHFFTEHGFIVLMVSANCRANYFQGLDKMFSRMTRDEYAWPEFANLGEEPIFTKELLADDNVEEDTIFGYTPRYSDYKSAVNLLKGDFTTSLKFWVQPREFANPPALNQQFIYDSAPLTPFAVQDGSDVILSIINFGVKASRLLPFYGSPTL